MPFLLDSLEFEPEHYSFNGSFAELRNEKCLILLSSGSRGQNLIQLCEEIRNDTNYEPQFSPDGWAVASAGGNDTGSDG